MKSLKNHLSVIFPLFVLLFSLQFTFLSDKIVTEYSNKLTKDYSIVVVSPKILDEAIVRSRINAISSIKQISSKIILDRLKGNISSKNISLLKIALPYFYSIKLKSFPNVKEVDIIKNKLIKNKFATKVETFSKTHTKVYQMFVLLKTVSLAFSILILIVSVLLMFKQIKIWLFEHKDRMAIMTLFGAPFWMKSALLYRLAIVDSFISTILVSVIYIILPSISEVKQVASTLDIIMPKFDILKDTSILLGISLIFSLYIVSSVIGKMNKE